MYPHRPIVSNSSRIPELLDQLKAEFETLAHDVNMYKMQRDDCERKLQAQLTELSSIQQTLFDVERNFQKTKQHYEEENLRLRRQAESNGMGFHAGRDREPSRVSTPTLHNIHTHATPSSSSTSSASSTSQLPSFPLLREPFNPSSSSSSSSSSSAPSAAPPSPTSSTPPLSSSLPGMSGPLPYGPPPSYGLAPLNASSLPSAGDKRNFSALNPNPKAGGGPPTKRPRFPDNEAFNLSPIAPPLDEVEKKEPKDMDSSLIPPLRTPNEGNGRTIPTPPTSRRAKEDSPAPTEAPEPPKSVRRTSGYDGGSGSEKELETKPKIVSGESGKGNNDWIVGYNPSVQTNLSIDLRHTLDHDSVVCCVRFSADGKFLATGCNRNAQIYDVETGEKIQTFHKHLTQEGDDKEDLYIRSVCFSPDSKLLVAGAEDKTVKVWDIAQNRIRHTLVGHELDIYSLDFSFDGQFVVSGSGDKKAKIWDIEKGKCLFTLGNEEVGPKDGVTSVAISPDGRLVAAGSLDRIVRLWDARTGYFLERYEGHLDSVYSVAFSPDGKSLASGSLDKTLKLWDLAGARSRSRCRSTFTGHKDFVLSVAFSPDGNWLISGSKDRSVQFWDPKLAVTHMCLQGHRNSVISVAVSPAGGVFATGSGDSRARLWKYAK